MAEHPVRAAATPQVVLAESALQVVPQRRAREDVVALAAGREELGGVRRHLDPIVTAPADHVDTRRGDGEDVTYCVPGWDVSKS